LAEYDVTVIDPRSAFGSRERFPDITLRNDWTDEALAELAPVINGLEVRCAAPPRG
jgi:xanthine dehydrogenase accessory factor